MSIDLRLFFSFSSTKTRTKTKTKTRLKLKLKLKLKLVAVAHIGGRRWALWARVLIFVLFFSFSRKKTKTETETKTKTKTSGSCVHRGEWALWAGVLIFAFGKSEHSDLPNAQCLLLCYYTSAIETNSEECKEVLNTARSGIECIGHC